MKQKNSRGTRRMFFANTLLSLLAYGLLEALTIGLENLLERFNLKYNRTKQTNQGHLLRLRTSGRRRWPQVRLPVFWL